MKTKREVIQALRSLLFALEMNLVIESPDIDALVQAINIIENADRAEQFVRTNDQMTLVED